ncbi:MAG: hypothetical protein JO362_09265 [Streptomycetaceae bacterium]|nr:hypothetical protein [Streptomycetaceae bacterium]
MSADDCAVPIAEAESKPRPGSELFVEDKVAPSMSALLAAGKAAHAVCTPPAAPAERPEEPDSPDQRDAA